MPPRMCLVLTVVAHAAAAVAARAGAPTLFPADFGADPTGRTDSTAAFKLLMSELLRNTSSHIMSGKAVDLGGATVDLQGGG
jgi:hypothetical protein